MSGMISYKTHQCATTMFLSPNEFLLCTYFCMTPGAENLFAHFTAMPSIKKAKFGLHTMETDLQNEKKNQKEFPLAKQ